MVTSNRRACDACHKRKIRCEPSQMNGVCDWCAHHQSACVVSPRKERRSPNNETANTLAKRLEAVERELRMVKASRESIQKPPSPATTLSTPQSASSAHRDTNVNRCTICRVQCAPPRTLRCLDNALLGQIFFAGHNSGLLCHRTGIPHFSPHCEEWIHAQTGQWPRFSFIPVEKPSAPWISRTPSLRFEMPDRWILDSLLDEFTRSDIFLIFPLIDSILFQETANLAYAGVETLTVDHISAKACVFAFLATSSARFPYNKASQLVDDEACAKKAQVMLSELVDDASLTNLQTFLMLLLIETGSGRIQAGSMYHAVSCRTATALGGHLTVFPVVSGRPFTMREREDRHLRMLFWLCYCFDKDLALRTGHPPVIDDRFCDLTLPEGWAKTRSEGRRRDPSNEDQMPSLPGDLRLCMLKSKTVDLLYANSSLSRSDAEILRTIRELDEELEEWRKSLPTQYSPSLSIKKGVTLPDDHTGSAGMLLIELHLEYHHLLNAIHAASGRCLAPGGGTDGPINYGVQSSLDVAVEASRSTLIYLTAASSRVAAEAFWVFVFYPMSALMTVFFSILRNPDGEHAIEDVELLANSSRSVHNMPKQKMVQSETVYLQQVDIFIAELCRLAHSAIQKSTDKMDTSI